MFFLHGRHFVPGEVKLVFDFEAATHPFEKYVLRQILSNFVLPLPLLYLYDFVFFLHLVVIGLRHNQDHVVLFIVLANECLWILRKVLQAFNQRIRPSLMNGSFWQFKLQLGKVWLLFFGFLV
jgi:hypothetical protein